jgi:hypothetical protein
VIALSGVVRMTRGLAPERPQRLAGVGAMLGAAVVVEYPLALCALGIAAYAVARLPRRALPWIARGSLAPAGVLAWYQAAAFGGPLRLAYEFSTLPFRGSGLFMGLAAFDAAALHGILFSAYRGLFYGAPWLLLSVPGALLWWRRGAHAEVLLCAGLALAFLWLNASLADWHGFWGMGPRHLIPIVPWLVVLASGVFAPPAAARGRRWPVRLVAGVLVAYSALGMLAGTAVKPEVPIHVRRPFLDFHYPQLRAGQVAISTQTFDMKSPVQGGPPAAWNLGQLLGLEGALSLAPLAGWCATWSALLARRAR